MTARAMTTGAPRSARRSALSASCSTPAPRPSSWRPRKPVASATPQGVEAPQGGAPCRPPQEARDRRNGGMPDVYTVTPQPVAGQQGSPLIRWLDRYAQAHAAAVAQMTVGDFSPWVVAQIDEAVDGDTVTTTNFAMVVTLMARLGGTRGLRCVPLAMADAVTITRALVLEKALVPLHTKALIGDEAVDVPQTGQTSPLGAALQGWLDTVLRA